MDYIDNIYVINMDRSTERLTAMQKQVPKLGKQFVRISGVDGSKLSRQEIQSLSTGLCGLFCTNSMIGCFLSHKKTWEAVVKNRDSFALIMEDDCEVASTFQADLKLVMDELAPIHPDFIYLGCFGGCEYDKSNYDLAAQFQRINRLSTTNKGLSSLLKYSYVPEAPLGFHCYIISRQFAQKMLEMLPYANFHIDVSFLRVAKDSNVYASKKKLGFQFSRAELSTQTVNKFPVMANYIFDKVTDNNGMSYSFYLGSPFFELFWNPVDMYFLIALSIAIFTKNKKHMMNGFTILFLLEFILRPSNVRTIAFWFIMVFSVYSVRK